MGSNFFQYRKYVLPFLSIIALLFVFQNCGTEYGSESKYGSQNKSQEQLNQNSIKCKFNGQKMEVGETVMAFFKGNVPHGVLCESEMRKCSESGLTGSAPYAACTQRLADMCLHDGVTVGHHKKIMAYVTEVVPYGESCEGAELTCIDGVLGQMAEEFPFASCRELPPSDCAYNGDVLEHGSKTKVYSRSTIHWRESADKETCPVEQEVTCNNGVISPSYARSEFPYTSCTVSRARKCNYNGVMINHGATVRAYTASVVYGGVCHSREVSCNDGTISPSSATREFPFLSCRREFNFR